MSDHPQVSVVIPCYNAAAWLPRALASVERQTFAEWEVVLVDDGSVDATPHVVESWSRRLGARLRSYRADRVGSSAARNRGIDEARGRFVAFLDADDEFLPEKLSRQMALFERRPELGLVFSDYAYVDLQGVRMPSAFDIKCRLPRLLPVRRLDEGHCVCPTDLFDWLLNEYFISTITSLVRRDVIGRDIRFPEGISYAEEWLFYLKVSRACRCGFVDDALCLHHHVSGSLSRTDTHDNHLRLLALLERMAAELRPLSAVHRKVIDRHLARANTQLGYDLSRRGRHGQGAAHFLRAARHDSRPTASLLRAGAAAVRSLGIPKGNDAQSGEPSPHGAQAPSIPVR